MTVKICASIMPENLDNALNLIDKAEEYQADFIEVRLDCLKEYGELSDIVNCAETPLIATNRNSQCGGKFSGSEIERKNTLFSAAQSGFEYVDIEIDAPWLKDMVKALREIDVKPIISFHDFKKTPGMLKLRQVLEREISEGAEVCKIVTAARNLQDNLTLMSLLLKESKRAKIVCFAMGTLGKPSRLLSPIFGGYFTIAALERGAETAPGQMSIQDLKAAYKAMGII